MFEKTNQKIHGKSQMLQGFMRMTCDSVFLLFGVVLW
jgi:hypothetical protein